MYSSRRIQQATFDSVAFRYIAADQHPDHDTISTFRQRFLPQLQALFVQVLVLAGELKVLQLGKISLDGTKVQANASKHSALSYGHALKQEDPLRAEPESLGTVDTQLTDAGYFSGSNVGACVQAGIEPLMATGREAHHYSLWAHDALPEAQACHEHR